MATGGLIQKLTLPSGAYLTNGYDAMARLANTTLKSSAHGVLNSHAYLYNPQGWVTNQTRTDGSFAGYTYDKIGQIKTAKAKEPGGTDRLHERFTYTYNAAGNLTEHIDNVLTRTFGIDTLDQITSVTPTGNVTAKGTTSSTASQVTVNGFGSALYGDKTFAKEGFALSTTTFTAIANDASGRSDTNSVTVPASVTQTFSYDLNGNLLSDGRRGFDYDDENQLIRLTSTNTWKSEFLYDGLRRRRQTKEYAWTGSAWLQTNLVQYVYFGSLVVQERHYDPRVSTTYPQRSVSYTRRIDLSGSEDGAGGIGGLLARSEHTPTSYSHAYYHADGSGNVTALINESQAVVARYLYDPFGNIVASSGPLADANRYRFSSKELHPNSGLVYYGYRFYEPSLQRWINRDPIGIEGGVNLSRFVSNCPMGMSDAFGLAEDPVYAMQLLRGRPAATGGSGQWKPETPDTHDLFLWAGLRKLVSYVWPSYPRAARFMNYYLEGSGRERSIDLGSLIKTDSNSRVAFAAEVDAAMHFAERVDPELYGDGFVFSKSAWSTVLTINHDWIFAIGGYKTSIQALVIRSGDVYQMTLTYYLDDWYNWDEDKTIFFGLPDATLGRLHTVGLAQEYHIVGKYRVKFSWTVGQSFDRKMLEPRWPEDRVQ